MKEQEEQQKKHQSKLPDVTCAVRDYFEQLVKFSETVMLNGRAFSDQEIEVLILFFNRGMDWRHCSSLRMKNYGEELC